MIAEFKFRLVRDQMNRLFRKIGIIVMVSAFLLFGQIKIALACNTEPGTSWLLPMGDRSPNTEECFAAHYGESGEDKLDNVANTDGPPLSYSPYSTMPLSTPGDFTFATVRWPVVNPAKRKFIIGLGSVNVGAMDHIGSMALVSENSELNPIFHPAPKGELATGNPRWQPIQAITNANGDAVAPNPNSSAQKEALRRIFPLGNFHMSDFSLIFKVVGGKTYHYIPGGDIQEVYSGAGSPTYDENHKRYVGLVNGRYYVFPEDDEGTIYVSYGSTNEKYTLQGKYKLIRNTEGSPIPIETEFYAYVISDRESFTSDGHFSNEKVEFRFKDGGWEITYIQPSNSQGANLTGFVLYNISYSDSNVVITSEVGGWSAELEQSNWDIKGIVRFSSATQRTPDTASGYVSFDYASQADGGYLSSMKDWTNVSARSLADFQQILPGKVPWLSEGSQPSTSQNIVDGQILYEAVKTENGFKIHGFGGSNNQRVYIETLTPIEGANGVVFNRIRNISGQIDVYELPAYGAKFVTSQTKNGILKSVDGNTVVVSGIKVDFEHDQMQRLSRTLFYGDMDSNGDIADRPKGEHSYLISDNVDENHKNNPIIPNEMVSIEDRRAFLPINSMMIIPAK